MDPHAKLFTVSVDSRNARGPALGIEHVSNLWTRPLRRQLLVKFWGNMLRSLKINPSRPNVSAGNERHSFIHVFRAVMWAIAHGPYQLTKRDPFPLGWQFIRAIRLGFLRYLILRLLRILPLCSHLR